MLRNLIFPIFIVLFFSACTSKNVTYYGKGSTPEEMTSDIIDLHMDAFGDLYPFGELNRKYNEGNNSQLFKFIKNTKVCNDVNIGRYTSILCEGEKKNIDNNLSNEQYQKIRNKWEEAQLKLWKIYADLISSQIKKNKYSEVLVLIHGFNVPNSQESFSDMRKPILERYRTLNKDKPLILQVSWDGFEGISPFNWTKAQASGSLAGFELRKLFNLLEKKLKVMPSFKILTHSSGSFVIGTTLGNPVTAQELLCKRNCHKKSEAYSWIKAYDMIKLNNPSELYKIPNLKGVKMLMIAAATPSTTFTGNSTNYCPQSKEWYGFHQKESQLLLTLNKYDYALTKSYFLKTPIKYLISKFSIGENAFGNSGLGAKKEQLKILEESMKKRNILVKFEDFSLINKKKNTDHSISTYMNAQQMKILLDSFIK